METRYEYEGKIYSDEDLEDKIDNYGGDVWDLGYELEHDGVIEKADLFCYNGRYYDSYRELIESETEDLYSDGVTIKE